MDGEVDDYEQIKYHFARYCWPRRDDRTPSDRCTWGELFRDKYGESLNAYAQRVRNDADSL